MSFLARLGGWGWIRGPNSTSWHVLYPDTSELHGRGLSLVSYALLGYSGCSLRSAESTHRAPISPFLSPHHHGFLASQQEVREVSGDRGPPAPSHFSLRRSWSLWSCPTAQVSRPIPGAPLGPRPGPPLRARSRPGCRFGPSSFPSLSASPGSGPSTTLSAHAYF